MQGCKGEWKGGWINRYSSWNSPFYMFDLLLAINFGNFSFIISNLAFVTLFQIFLSFWYSNTYLTPPEIASEFLCVLFHFFKNSPFCLNLHSWSLCCLWWSFLGHVQTTDKLTNGKLKLVFLICSINFWFLLIFHLFTLQIYYVSYFMY